MRKLLTLCATAMLAASGTQANANWYQATSKHFVIFADEDPRQLSDFANRLERFDQAVRLVRGMDDPPVGLGNRLTVFVLSNVEAVQQLAGGDKFIDGFYIGRASGSCVWVPRKPDSDADEAGMSAEVVFFHEYAHHLMFQINDRPLPEWVVEGFAEFMSTARFEKNGDVGLGVPPKFRAYGLFGSDQLPLERLLAGNYSKITVDQRESIYGRAWLLIHYLSFEPARAGQLERYVDLISKGTPSIEAARTAFGDLRQLDRELDTYLNRHSLKYLRLSGAKFHSVPITVTGLSAGAAKVIPLRAQSKRGVDEKTAEPLAVKVRALEAQFPGDELIELTLSEAELDAGHAEASIKAADRVLHLNPANTKAMILKGRATESLGEKMSGPQHHQTFVSARNLFLAANKVDTEDPEALAEFYQSYLTEGVRPTDNAIAALHYASDLAPQDEGLRMNSAIRYIEDGKSADAKQALRVVAYDPHGGSEAELARAIIEKIDSGAGKEAILAVLNHPSDNSKGN
jgi:tetratricopeptide (TPR) repeat protein